jgi:hypothetical protein
MSLNSIFDFDYEFYFFTEDVTDPVKFDTIYNQCTIPDQSGNRKDLIYKKGLEIVQLLLAALGFHIFSTFVKVDNKTYKVTVHNMIWAGEGLF